MNRSILAVLVLVLFSFSSCLHRSATDAGTDKALGAGGDRDAAQAQQEFEDIQKDQLVEQKHQLDRQITDPLQSR